MSLLKKDFQRWKHVCSSVHKPGQTLYIVLFVLGSESPGLVFPPKVLGLRKHLHLKVIITKCSSIHLFLVCSRKSSKCLINHIAGLMCRRSDMRTNAECFITEKYQENLVFGVFVMSKMKCLHYEKFLISRKQSAPSDIYST